MWFKEQYHLLLVAISFLTRIPVSLWRDYLPTDSQQAVKYYPLVGLFLGLVIATIIYMGQFLLPIGLSILLAIAVSLLLTGALHEDGLADCVDAFGVSNDRARILAVMKDSQLGTYAVLALGIALLYKFYSLLLLAEIGIDKVLIAVVLAYSMSRLIAISLMCQLAYVRIEDSKVLAEVHRLKGRDCYYAALTVAPALFFVPITLLFSLIFILFCVRYLLVKYFRFKLGGYTGDCLGAAQQVSELVIYSVFVGFFCS